MTRGAPATTASSASDMPTVYFRQAEVVKIADSDARGDSQRVEKATQASEAPLVIGGF